MVNVNRGNSDNYRKTVYIEASSKVNGFYGYATKLDETGKILNPYNFVYENSYITKDNQGNMTMSVYDPKDQPLITVHFDAFGHRIDSMSQQIENTKTLGNQALYENEWEDGDNNVHIMKTDHGVMTDTYTLNKVQYKYEDGQSYDVSGKSLYIKNEDIQLQQGTGKVLKTSNPLFKNSWVGKDDDCNCTVFTHTDKGEVRSHFDLNGNQTDSIEQQIQNALKIGTKTFKDPWVDTNGNMHILKQDKQGAVTDTNTHTGQTTTLQKNGTFITVDQNGVQKVKNADGSALISDIDGSTTVTKPDGSIQFTNPVTGNTTTTSYGPDGKPIITTIPGDPTYKP